MGEKINDFYTGKMPLFEIGEGSIKGEIIYIDRFGNVITNIEQRYYANRSKIVVTIKGIKIEDFNRSFSSVRQGENLIYTGSMNFLEIGKSEGNFAEEYNIKFGDEVVLTYKNGEM